MAMRKSTADSRRCNSSMVFTSLNSGTTIDSRVSADGLRDMAKTPAHGGREIVADQMKTVGAEHRPRLETGEQRQFEDSRVEQPCRHPLQCVVDVAGMDHQFGDAGTDASQRPVQTTAIEDAGVHAADQCRRAETELCGDPIVAA